jgi:two-component system nitrate/nitrite response regulator NarL
VWRRTGGNPYRLTELLAVEGANGPAGLVPAPDLTAREREVLGLLAEGMSNKQIARALGISVRTVTVHVSNLLRKTGAASRTEAALMAIRAA